MSRLRIIFSAGLVMLLLIQVACASLTPAWTTQTSTGTSMTETTGPTATATVQTTQPENGLDDRLSGAWTNEPDRTRVQVDQMGKPVGSVPVGDWYLFDGKGRYVRIARFMTFAIGGILVEEGRYQTENATVTLYDRTESFFPDPGSPQKAKYRETTLETVFIRYRPAVENSIDVLYLKSGADGEEVRFRRCVDD